MKPSARQLGGATIIGGLLLAGALLVWPIGAGPVVPAPAPEVFRGPDQKTNRGSPVTQSAIRLSSGASAQEARPVAQPTPTLVGIAGGQAYLKSIDSGEIERAGVGGTVDGWKVVAVGNRTVTLRGGAGDQRLRLFEKPNVAPASGPAPAAAPDAAPAPVGG